MDSHGVGIQISLGICPCYHAKIVPSGHRAWGWFIGLCCAWECQSALSETSKARSLALTPAPAHSPGRAGLRPCTARAYERCTQKGTKKVSGGGVRASDLHFIVSEKLIVTPRRPKLTKTIPGPAPPTGRFRGRPGPAGGWQNGMVGVAHTAQRAPQATHGAGGCVWVAGGCSSCLSGVCRESPKPLVITTALVGI